MHTLSTRGNQQQQALLGMTHLGWVQRHPLPQWHAKKVNQAWLQQCSKLKGERARKWQGACEAVRKTLITPYKYFQAFFFSLLLSEPNHSKENDVLRSSTDSWNQSRYKRLRRKRRREILSQHHGVIMASRYKSSAEVKMLWTSSSTNLGIWVQSKIMFFHSKGSGAYDLLRLLCLILVIIQNTEKPSI